MKTQVKRAMVIPLIAVFIGGSALLLNWSIAQAQGVENRKVVTNSPTETTAAANVAGITNANQTDTPDFIIVKNDTSWKDLLSDTDLSMNDAAMICAKELKYYFNVDTAKGRMEMTFSHQDGYRGLWQAYFTPADKSNDYYIIVDSITGHIHDINKYLRVNTSDCDQSKMEEQDKLRKDTRYINAVCDFIKAKMPDKDIVSTVNTGGGSMGGTSNINAFMVIIDVEFSDGSTYEFWVGNQTLDILSFHDYKAFGD